MFKFLLIKLIKFYQKFIPRRKGKCIFTPTCSWYAIEAIQKRGVIVGLILSIYRVLRCNPFNKKAGTLDKVPDKKSVVKWVY